MPHYVDIPEAPRNVIEVIVPGGGGGVQGPTTVLNSIATASYPLSGHRVVVTENDVLRYPNIGVAADSLLPMHLTTSSVESSQTATVVAIGKVTESSWNWQSGVPVYVGADGILTQVQPVGAAWMRIVGLVWSPTSLYFNPQSVIRTA